jgi:hypothetical protein
MFCESETLVNCKSKQTTPRAAPRRIRAGCWGHAVLHRTAQKGKTNGVKKRCFVSICRFLFRFPFPAYMCRFGNERLPPCRVRRFLWPSASGLSGKQRDQGLPGQVSRPRVGPGLTGIDNECHMPYSIGVASPGRSLALSLRDQASHHRLGSLA